MLKNIIFDLGGVLIDWNPRYLYRQIFNDDAVMEDFLKNVCTDEWNVQQDCGKTLAEGTNELCAKHPEKVELIRLFYTGWHKMLAGPIPETVTILKQLKQKNWNLYALTNWSHETFPYALQHFEFLQDFIDIVVSGREKIIKPDKRIFEIMLSRNNLNADESIFIDDNLRNIKAAEELGFKAIHFTSANELEKTLRDLGCFVEAQ